MNCQGNHPEKINNFADRMKFKKDVIFCKPIYEIKGLSLQRFLKYFQAQPKPASQSPAKLGLDSLIIRPEGNLHPPPPPQGYKKRFWHGGTHTVDQNQGAQYQLSKSMKMEKSRSKIMT